MGLFDILKNKLVTNTNLADIENLSLKRCIESIDRWNENEDTVYLTSSSVCPVCCIYDKRIFSVYGKDKRFPKLSNMPAFLKKRQCPECEKIIGYTIYFPYLKDKKALDKDIKFSNRPFVDDSPKDILKFRQESAEQSARYEQEEKEYKWISKNLPDIAPKSLSGYRRMKHNNSKNYQAIVIKAKEKGFTIQ